MLFKAPNRFSIGLLLGAITTVVIVWLSYTNTLNVYISSRYDIFALLMALLSLIGVGVSSSIKSTELRTENRPSFRVVGTIVLTGLLALSLLLLQPKALTSTTALQRGINAGGLNLAATTNTASFGETDYSQFDVRDWASVLNQTSDVKFYTGKTATITGFVSPVPGGNSNVFYASRFYITCCAMDAQPYGVPVYEPNWRGKYSPNSWVAVSGGFTSDPTKSSVTPIVLIPSRINTIPVPQDPYGR
ncbi:MAG TPA: TIGR03943 family protein [Verrucomicrobiae bacterium]|nr:TIGR03943 family protein [Verrucomicrobiae bacterium]